MVGLVNRYPGSHNPQVRRVFVADKLATGFVVLDFELEMPRRLAADNLSTTKSYPAGASDSEICRLAFYPPRNGFSYSSLNANVLPVVPSQGF